jgi:putative DNA primase/helicase
MAAAVRQRAEALAVPEAREPLAAEFVKECLDTNERGDGCMFAALHRERYMYNATPRDGEWYAWGGHVWQRDDFRRSFAAVEECALEYQRMAEMLKRDIETHGITKTHSDAWKIALREKYKKRIDRLRSAVGATKTLQWAPVVAPDMACLESDFDKVPHLLPVKNGVVDLRTGALTKGRPEDKLARALDIDYDPHADYTPWVEFINEIADDPEVAAFIKRSLGYGSTGWSHEQYIWVFTGPGRNGKGVLFDLIGDVMRPYYHVISRSMLIEQRNEPSPSAASEHKYSLLGQRIVVGGETNRGQRIDAGAVKQLTGDDEIVCRPNFKSEIVFKPSHTLFLHTNHVPVGLTRDFALVQRLLKIEFPYMYVDDPAAEAALRPLQAARFRKKDPGLKDKLRKYKAGILRWLVEGAMEWHEHGLDPPESIRKAVRDLAEQEDYTGRFLRDCLVRQDSETRISCQEMYNVFRWWWSQNEEDQGSKRIPAMKTINGQMRDRGVVVEMVGGKTWIYGYSIDLDIVAEVNEFLGMRS